jgi:hypothetical protein
MAAEQYRDADLVKAIRRIWAISNAAVSVASYNNLKSKDDPSSALIIQRLGSWQQACQLAKIPVNQPSRNYQSRHSASEIIALASRYLASTDQPSYKSFSGWLKQQSAAPSAQTCRNVIGSWQQILQQATD